MDKISKPSISWFLGFIFQSQLHLPSYRNQKNINIEPTMWLYPYFRLCLTLNFRYRKIHYQRHTFMANIPLYSMNHIDWYSNVYMPYNTITIYFLGYSSSRTTKLSKERELSASLALNTYTHMAFNPIFEGHQLKYHRLCRCLPLPSILSRVVVLSQLGGCRRR